MGVMDVMDVMDVMEARFTLAARSDRLFTHVRTERQSTAGYEAVS